MAETSESRSRLVYLVYQVIYATKWPEAHISDSELCLMLGEAFFKKAQETSEHEQRGKRNRGWTDKAGR